MGKETEEKGTEEKYLTFEFEVKCLTCGWQPDDPRAYQASDRNAKDAKAQLLSLAMLQHHVPGHVISVELLPKK